MPLRVILADDHQIVRHGIRTLLDDAGVDVVAEAADGVQSVAQARAHAPHVAVLDISMPELNGIEAARQMLSVMPGMAIVLLSMYADEEHVVQALRAGIRGYVLKSQAAADLLEAIHTVAGDGTYLSPKVSHIVVNAYVGGTDLAADPLTPRERDVLRLIVEGKTTTGIASTLDLTFKTAETHRACLMDKLKIHDTAGLVRYAVRRGIVTP